MSSVSVRAPRYMYLFVVVTIGRMPQYYLYSWSGQLSSYSNFTHIIDAVASPTHRQRLVLSKVKIDTDRNVRGLIGSLRIMTEAFGSLRDLWHQSILIKTRSFVVSLVFSRSLCVRAMTRLRYDERNSVVKVISSPRRGSFHALVSCLWIFGLRSIIPTGCHDVFLHASIKIDILTVGIHLQFLFDRFHFITEM